MDNKNLLGHKGYGKKLLLNTLALVAEKNAMALCRGFMYEPEVPEKLKRDRRKK